MRNVTFLLLIQGILALMLSQMVICEEKPSSAPSTSSSSSSRAGKASAMSSVSDDALERAIKDSRYFNRQFACLTSEGPCDQVGRRLKVLLPCAVKGTNCPEHPKDLRQINIVKDYMIENHPEKWQKLKKQINNAEQRKNQKESKDSAEELKKQEYINHNIKKQQ